MRRFDQENRWRPHVKIAQPATEPQAVISWGEDILERMHRMAHEIEEQVQRSLDAPVDPSSN